MSDLSSVVVGTKLRIPEQYSAGFNIRIVTRVTAASVTSGDHRFRKSDGLLIGSGDGRRRIYASIATDADLLAHRIACAKSRLQFIKVTAENLETVERLIAE